jgi:hypothetical protein
MDYETLLPWIVIDKSNGHERAAFLLLQRANELRPGISRSNNECSLPDPSFSMRV